jgi:outer membrane protein assembly factor BamB
MELTDRIVRIISLGSLGILAADVVGRLHVLDKDLKLIRSSRSLPATIPASQRPVYTLTVSGGWVVTKDMAGNIAKWSLDTLDLVDYYDAYSVCDRTLLMDGEEPSPVMSRGITVWDGQVYVNNGYRQLVVLDLESFTINSIGPSVTGDMPIEHFCTDHPDIHVISDKGGRLHFGSLATMEFPTMVKADESNIHRVCYDRRHERFWFSQDAGKGETAYLSHGVAIAGTDGTVVRQYGFATNDVEFVALSPGHEKAYAGGFNGVLHVFDNTTEELRLEATITGFGHQLIDLVVDADGSLYVLSQDGGLVKLDDSGAELARADFRRQCVWDIQPAADDPHTFYLATDDGVSVISVSDSRAGQPALRLVAHHVTGLGFTRRVVAMPDGWLGLSWDHKVFRASADGTLRWVRDLPAFGHTVAVSPGYDRVLVASDAGGLELSAATGDLLAQLSIEGLPIWAGTYLKSGERVLSTRIGQVRAFAPDSSSVAWTLDFGFSNYPKRMRATEDALYVIGGQGMKEIPLEHLTGGGELALGRDQLATVERRFVELLENTVENGVIMDGIACAVSYGGQLAAFNYESTEIIGLDEDIPDYPKAIAGLPAADGGRFIILGGRGGYLRIYRLDGDPGQISFVKLRETYLPRSGSRPVAALRRQAERRDRAPRESVLA